MEKDLGIFSVTFIGDKMETKFVPKIPKYFCDFCQYKTSNKKDYTKHLMTSKHTKETFGDAKNPQNPQNPQNHVSYECELCNKAYLSRNGLWKHKKKCSTHTTKITEDNEIIDNNNVDENIISIIVKQNQEFKELIVEQNQKILELVSGQNITNNNITNTTNNNNKFNLNVFLNETCKDALNMSEFLESLTLCLNDFENFGPLGYCGGITNILIKGLKTLDVNKRPIHCSDLKREVIHIKNNDVWQKDEEQTQMIKAIKAIEHKNMKQMTLWAKANPEYKDANHKKSDLYTKLMDNSLGEIDKEKAHKNYHKIIRNVAKEVLVEK
jgi:hypothetical protein